MADATGICASCGMSKDPGWAYCVHCGAPASAGPATGAGAGAVPPPRTQPLQVPPASPQAPPPPPPPLPPPVQPGATASYAPGVVHVAGLRTQRGFFASLFDVSFTSLVMTKIIKVLYILSMIWIGLTALFYVFAALRVNGTLGLLTLFVIAPAISLLLLIYTRLLLELSIAVFRIMENTGELVAQGQRE